MLKILYYTRFISGEGERKGERESMVGDGKNGAVVRHSREESRDSG